MPFVLLFAALCFLHQFLGGQKRKNRLQYCSCVDNNQSCFSGSPEEADAVENLTCCWWRIEFMMKWFTKFHLTEVTYCLGRIVFFTPYGRRVPCPHLTKSTGSSSGALHPSTSQALPFSWPLSHTAWPQAVSVFSLEEREFCVEIICPRPTAAFGLPSSLRNSYLMLQHCECLRVPSSPLRPSGTEETGRF